MHTVDLVDRARRVIELVTGVVVAAFGGHNRPLRKIAKVIFDCFAIDSSPKIRIVFFYDTHVYSMHSYWDWRTGSRNHEIQTIGWRRSFNTLADLPKEPIGLLESTCHSQSKQSFLCSDRKSIVS
jgi:hypothetical protein